MAGEFDITPGFAVHFNMELAGFRRLRSRCLEECESCFG